MRAIKLHFPDPNHLLVLLNDKAFFSAIRYLSPHRLDDNNLALFDPVTHHAPLETEIVVLSKFARGIKDILFPDQPHEIEFLDARLGNRKGGLRIENTRIIDSTDVEMGKILMTILEE
jgi:hypothetical protein